MGFFYDEPKTFFPPVRPSRFASLSDEERSRWVRGDYSDEANARQRITGEGYARAVAALAEFKSLVSGEWHKPRRGFWRFNLCQHLVAEIELQSKLNPSTLLEAYFGPEGNCVFLNLYNRKEGWEVTVVELSPVTIEWVEARL